MSPASRLVRATTAQCGDSAGSPAGGIHLERGARAPMLRREGRELLVHVAGERDERIFQKGCQLRRELMGDCKRVEERPHGILDLRLRRRERRCRSRDAFAIVCSSTTATYRVTSCCAATGSRDGACASMKALHPADDHDRESVSIRRDMNRTQGNS